MTTIPTVLHGVIAGKLSKAEGTEDFLTSQVFGVLGWMPPSLGMCAFLKRAAPAFEDLDDVASVELELWPWWDEHEELAGSEPDVVLTLHPRVGVPRLVVIECKRASGLGYKQLVRQVANGMQIANQRRILFAGVVLLSRHVSLPVEDVCVSEADIRADLGLGLPVRWLSWRDLGPVLASAAVEIRGSSPVLAALADDLVECLTRWGMTRFDGFDLPPLSPNRSFRLSWPDTPVPPVWQFSQGYP